MPWPPPRRPVITVSATHDARQAATAASAAEPPSSRISIPASTVAGCPAATPAFINLLLAFLGLSRETLLPCARPQTGLAACIRVDRPGLRNRLCEPSDPHQRSQTRDHRHARPARNRHRLGAGADRAVDDPHQRA